MEDRLLDRLVARLDDRDRDRSRKKRQRGDESPPKPSNPDRGTAKNKGTAFVLATKLGHYQTSRHYLEITT